MNKEIDQIYAFSTLIEKLKKIERFKDQFYWKDYPQLPRYESVADHSWRLATLVLFFSNKLKKKLDLEKALMITLVHDLPEIYAGDDSPMGDDGTGKNTYAYDEDKQKTRYTKEEKCAKELFSILDKENSEKLFNLWSEYENLTSYESKVVKALDKVECLRQVLEYTKCNMFKAHLDFSIKYAMKYVDIDPVIEEYGKKIVKELEESFMECESNY